MPLLCRDVWSDPLPNFYDRVVYVSLVSCQSSLHVLDTSLFSDMQFADTFPLCGLSLHCPVKARNVFYFFSGITNASGILIPFYPPAMGTCCKVPKSFMSRVVGRCAQPGHGPQMLRGPRPSGKTSWCQRLTVHAVGPDFAPSAWRGLLGVGLGPQSPCPAGCPRLLSRLPSTPLPSEPSHRTANGEWRDAGLDTHKVINFDSQKLY